MVSRLSSEMLGESRKRVLSEMNWASRTDLGESDVEKATDLLISFLVRAQK